MSSITDLSAYAEKRLQEGYEYGKHEDADYDVACTKGEAFLRGYLQARMDISEAWEERIFRQGWDAYFRGEPEKTCPYTEKDEGAEQNWLQGWEHAEERIGIKDLTTEEIDAAYEGSLAYHANVSLSACPYPENSTTRHWWINQWEASREWTEKPGIGLDTLPMEHCEHCERMFNERE